MSGLSAHACFHYAFVNDSEIIAGSFALNFQSPVLIGLEFDVGAFSGREGLHHLVLRKNRLQSLLSLQAGGCQDAAYSQQSHDYFQKISFHNAID